VVEVVGVAAGGAQLVVEAAGQEAQLAHRRELRGGRLERLRLGGREQPHVDQRVERAPDRALVDGRGEAGDDARLDKPADAGRDGVRAEPGELAQLAVGGASVSDQLVEDDSVDLVHDRGNHIVPRGPVTGPRR
jgi:hypothetical protein